MKDITKKNGSRPQIFAVGDVSFERRLSVSPAPLVFGELERYIKGWDICIANLENPLTTSSNRIAGKCTFRGDPGWAEVLKKAGINLVSLANNHMMDYGPLGLLETLRVLDCAGVQHFGAGRHLAEALAPLFVDARGTRVALLGRSSIFVSSPCYAGRESPGVAPFDLEETKQAIRHCKSQAEIVVVGLHWGVEHYKYPTPTQRRYARALIEAGADIILGHHSHVLQGVERVNSGLVSYSLGNFLFDDIRWSFVDKEGQRQERVVELNEDSRKGGILTVGLSNQGIDSHEFIPTYIDRDGRVKIDNTLERQQEFTRLCFRLHWPAYSTLWRLYSLRQEWKLRLKPMTIGRLKWANLKKIRPKHFRELLGGMCRSSKIVSGNSTNPYE